MDLEEVGITRWLMKCITNVCLIITWPCSFESDFVTYVLLQKNTFSCKIDIESETLHVGCSKSPELKCWNSQSCRQITNTDRITDGSWNNSAEGRRSYYWKQEEEVAEVTTGKQGVFLFSSCWLNVKTWDLKCTVCIEGSRNVTWSKHDKLTRTCLFEGKVLKMNSSRYIN